MKVLVTNDDGIRSAGLAALAEALAPLGDVVVVAPDRERSAASHSLTLHRPLRIEQVRPGWFTIDGTPSDCVYIGFHKVLGGPADLVVSGINRGLNLGDDVTYSGTVSAAMEGTLLGSASFAISMDAHNGERYEGAAAFAAKLAASILSKGLPDGSFLNVNVPGLEPSEILGWRITRQGKRRYTNDVIEKEDPRGRKYYWIGGDQNGHEKEDDCDLEAVAHGFISVTPLQLDLTHYALMEELRHWKL